MAQPAFQSDICQGNTRPSGIAGSRIDPDWSCSLTGTTTAAPAPVRAELLDDLGADGGLAQAYSREVSSELPVKVRPSARPVAKPGAADDLICFTPGTRILTSHGERPIESLRVGDRVVTRDHGVRPIRWIGRRKLPGTGSLAPICIARNQGEQQDALRVSARHRVLFTGPQARILFGHGEVLVPARFLVDGQGIQQIEHATVTYMHLMFDRHEIIYADGIATESFHAGDQALGALDPAALDQLFKIFPELRSMAGQHRRPARPCLNAQDARLLSQSAGAITLNGEVIPSGQGPDTHQPYSPAMARGGIGCD